MGSVSPAAEAAERARIQILACIDARRNFLVEAGAGAGKTRALTEALRHIVETRGRSLARRNQKVACITYTNVAADEIAARTDRHPAIQSSTIHSFCWQLIRPFQSFLREALPDLGNWSERIKESGSLGSRRVQYDLGIPRVEDDRVFLHHNDVIALTVQLLERQKFRAVLRAAYPIVLVDEYQDTDRDFARALVSHILETKEPILLGFFGDHWQRIYGTGCGRLNHTSLEVIGIGANFRSAPRIVDVLNRLRPELVQKVSDPSARGQVAVYHTNEWLGTRRTGQHWDGDLPRETASEYLAALHAHLEGQGWSFDPTDTKILMLTHKVLASEQGYSGIETIFQYSEAFLKKEDPHIAFLCEIVEPVCRKYEERRFGEMFELLGVRNLPIVTHNDKESWAHDMDALLRLRATGTIGDVLDHLKRTHRPRFPGTVERLEQELERQESDAEDDSTLSRLRRLREASYMEIRVLTDFINDSTPFSTKHGVKGAEFDNVLVVLGRGWNQYNFCEFLELAANPGKVSSSVAAKYERNRNLFYVVCSRAKTRLALLFTQKLSSRALSTLEQLFGSEAIHSFRISGDA